MSIPISGPSSPSSVLPGSSSEVAGAAAKVSSCQSAIAGIQNDIASIQQEIAAVLREIAALEPPDPSQFRRQETRETGEPPNVRIETIEVFDHQAFNAKMQEYQSKLNDLQGKLQSLQQQLAGKQQELATKERELAEAHKDLQKAMTKAPKAQEQLQEQLRQIQEQQEQLVREQQRLDQAQESLRVAQEMITRAAQAKEQDLMEVLPQAAKDGVFLGGGVDTGLLAEAGAAGAEEGDVPLPEAAMQKMAEVWSSLGFSTEEIDSALPVAGTLAPTVGRIEDMIEGVDSISVMGFNVPRGILAGLRGVVTSAVTAIGQHLPGTSGVNLEALLGNRPEVPPFPDPSALPISPDPSDRNFVSVPGELWPAGVGPLPTQDVRQADFGDCYFMASLAGLSPDHVENMIQDNQDGTYTVRLYDVEITGKSEPVFVRVTGDLPDAGSARHDNVPLWPAIIEKAYCVHLGGYDVVSGDQNSKFFEAPSHLTGLPTVAYLTPVSGADVTFERLADATADQRPAFAGYMGEHGDGIYADHAYTIVSVRTDDAGQRYVTVRNPWGDSIGGHPTEPSTDGVANDGVTDGIFEMPLEDFMSTFQAIAVAGG